MKLNHRHQRGLTLIEVLVVLVLVVVLIGLLLPAKRGGGPSLRMRCFTDLKQCGLSLVMWADDHGGKFPFQVSTNQGGSLEYVGSKEVYRHFLVVSNELSNPKVLRCPCDPRLIQEPDECGQQRWPRATAVGQGLSAHWADRSAVAECLFELNTPYT